MLIHGNEMLSCGNEIFTCGNKIPSGYHKTVNPPCVFSHTYLFPLLTKSFSPLSKLFIPLTKSLPQLT